MIVVPDAGPLIYLAVARKLDIIRNLYDRAIVPREVYEEIVVAGAGLMGSGEVSAATWLEVDDAGPDPMLVAALDRGEAAAIPLAQRLGATLLCDDAAGRVEARRRHIRVVGTLGVLVAAKHAGLLDRIHPVIQTMREAGMYISEALVSEVLMACKEDSADPVDDA